MGENPSYSRPTAVIRITTPPRPSERLYVRQTIMTGIGWEAVGPLSEGPIDKQAFRNGMLHQQMVDLVAGWPVGAEENTFATTK